jgi:hypothetical protein
MKRSCLNLYDKETLTQLFKIDHTAVGVNLVGTQPVIFNQPLTVKHASGDFTDVASKLHSVDAEFVTSAANTQALVTAVEAQLASNVATLNASIGTLQSGLTNETAQRQSGQIADADARVQVENTLNQSISNEIARATAAEQSNTDAITNLATSAAADLNAEQAARIAAIANIQSQVNFISSNVDAAAVDSITELLAKMSTDDGSLLTLSTTLQAQVTQLQQIIDELTSNQVLVEAAIGSANEVTQKANATSITSQAEMTSTSGYFTINGNVVYIRLNINNLQYQTALVNWNATNFPAAF